MCGWKESRYQSARVTHYPTVGITAEVWQKCPAVSTLFRYTESGQDLIQLEKREKMTDIHAMRELTVEEKATNEETKKHINQVRWFISEFIGRLKHRA